MPIITAVVLGGTQQSWRQRHTILGTALASLVIGILRFGLSMSGVNTQYLDIPVGALLIVSVAIRSVSSNDRLVSFIKHRFKRSYQKPNRLNAPCAFVNA